MLNEKQSSVDKKVAIQNNNEADIFTERSAYSWVGVSILQNWDYSQKEHRAREGSERAQEVHRDPLRGLEGNHEEERDR